MIFFDPLEELRLRGTEDIIGITLHVRQDGGEGARPFAVRLADGPQPAQVDVGVPDGSDVQVGITALFGEQGGKRMAGLDSIGVIETTGKQPHGIVEGGEDLGVTGGILGQDFEQIEQDLEIVEQCSAPGDGRRRWRLQRCARCSAGCRTGRWRRRLPTRR